MNDLSNNETLDRREQLLRTLTASRHTPHSAEWRGISIALRDLVALDPDNDAGVPHRSLIVARDLVGRTQFERADRCYAEFVVTATDPIPAATVEDIAFLFVRRQWSTILTWVERSRQEATDEVMVAYSVALYNAGMVTKTTNPSPDRDPTEADDLSFLLCLYTGLADGVPPNVDPDALGISVSPRVRELGNTLMSVCTTGRRDELRRALDVCESSACSSEALHRVSATAIGWAWLLSDPFEDDPKIAARVRSLVSRPTGPAPGAAGRTRHQMLGAIDSYTGAAIVRRLCAADGTEPDVPVASVASTTEPLLVRSVRVATQVRESLGCKNVEDRADDLETLLVENLRASRRETPVSALLRITNVLALLRAGSISDAQLELQALAQSRGELAELEWVDSGLQVTRSILDLLRGPWPIDDCSEMVSLGGVAQGHGYWATQARRLVAEEPETATSEEDDYQPATLAGAASRLARSGLAARDLVATAGVLSDKLVEGGYGNHLAIASLRATQAELLLRLGRKRHAVRVCDYISSSLLDPARMPRSIAERVQIIHGRALAFCESYTEALAVLEPRVEDPVAALERLFLLGVAAFGSGDHARARRELQSLLSISIVDTSEHSIRHRDLAMRWLGRLDTPMIHENGVPSSGDL